MAYLHGPSPYYQDTAAPFIFRSSWFRSETVWARDHGVDGVIDVDELLRLVAVESIYVIGHREIPGTHPLPRANIDIDAIPIKS